MKLTKAQMVALEMLPVTIPTWGGSVFGGMPRGIRSRSTLQALERRGLAELGRDGLRDRWSITPAGRAALEASDDKA